MTDPDHAPWVVTLALDAVSQALFDRLRRRWFPPQRLVVDAHLTLFHAVPAEPGPPVTADCRTATGTAPFQLLAQAPRSLGRGVAIDLDAPQLQNLHASLRGRWLPWLTPQDRQPFRPHITVQNKVEPALARATLTQVAAAFEPGLHLAIGLDLWRYRNGPWEHIDRVQFEAPENGDAATAPACT